jgi:hypothetical protein
MRWSLSRLRPRHIALLTAAYWIGLAVLKLGGAMLAAWWVARLAPGHGSITASLEGTLLSLRMIQDGATIWSGSASLATIAGWAAGPPLLLALTWRWARDVDAAGKVAPHSVSAAPPESAPLPSPPPIAWPDTTRIVQPPPVEPARLRTPPDGQRR